MEKIIKILREIVFDIDNRRKNIEKFQKLIWDDNIEGISEMEFEILGDLAYDLDFYVENPEWRKEDQSYYGDERLEIEIENKISDDAGIPRGFLLLDMPASEMSEFKVLVEYDNCLKKIDEVSELAKALEKAELERLTFCIYADPKYRENVKDLDIDDYIQYTQTMLKKFY